MRAASRIAVAAWLLAASAPLASASPKSVADKTFKRGRELMAKKQYAEACAAFEQSQQVDPQLGTLFNLAECDVQLGKVTEAWKIYRELSVSDPNADRKRLSTDSAADLERDMPRVLITVAARPASLAIEVDGNESTALVGVATPVDVGTHAVVAHAPGFREWTGTFDATMSHVERVTVQLEPIDAGDAPHRAGAPRGDAHAPPDAHVDAPEPTPEPVPASRAHTGKLVTIGGLSTVAAGLVVGGFAFSEWRLAQGCGACTASQEHDTSHTATVLGDISTAVVIVGLVPTAAGLYLWRTGSSAAVITPQVGGDHVGAAIVGRF